MLVDTHSQAKNILERHLVISDKVFTMADLKAMGNNETIVLPTIRDSLTVRVKEDDKRKYISFTYLLFARVYTFTIPHIHFIYLPQSERVSLEFSWIFPILFELVYVSIGMP